MIDVERRLAELGDLLAVDDADLAGAVTARSSAPALGAGHRRWWRAAAAVVLVVAAALAAVPSARDTVAGWLGLDRVSVERDDTRVPPDAPVVTAPAGADPLDETIVDVDGTAVLVGTIDGRLSDVFLTKTIGAGGTAVSLDIDGMPAMWVAEPHDVIIERGGEPVVERIAGSTLLWQDGAVLHRAEGLATLDQAVAFVRSR